jgi:uncharacterized damage-inducible protein DinB
VRSQVQAFAEQFQANNAEYVAAVAGCSDEGWSRTGANEERTIGVIAFHMATVQGGLAGLIEAVMAGRPTRAPRSIEEIDRMNEDHARNHAEVTKEEVLNALSASGQAFSTQLRFLTDADLDRSVGVLVGSEMTIGQVIRYAVLGHQREHLDSIREALGSRTPD